MIVDVSADAEMDLSEGYWFYERQSPGLGTYFLACLVSDIELLVDYGGIHAREYGYHRSLSKRFPFAIYYRFEKETVTVVAVLDARRNPLWIRQRLG